MRRKKRYAIGRMLENLIGRLNLVQNLKFLMTLEDVKKSGAYKSSFWGAGK